MNETQKLREALQEVIAYARESGHDWLCLIEAEQALALPTEPAVNQQLTTEPIDEREAFEREMRCEEEWGHRSLKKRKNGKYENWQVDLMWDVWQARAAIAQVGDINAVESFTNDTKDALMAGRSYAQEALIRHDDAYDRHPSTEPERNAILTDIQLIDAATSEEGERMSRRARAAMRKDKL